MAQKDTPTLVDAEEAFEARDVETALAICEGLIGDHEAKASVEVLYLASECLLELQEPQEAEHLLQIAIKKAGDEPVLLHARGVAVFEQGRLDEAAVFFEAALQGADDLGEARYYLGILAERAGDIEKADALFAEAVDRDPENLMLPTAWDVDTIKRSFDELVEEIADPLGAWFAGLQLSIEDLPSEAVLTGGETPVSPLVLCFFEGTGPGAPEGDDPEAWLTTHPDIVRVYRRNLGKSAHNEYQLHTELLEGLLWEVMEFLSLEEAHLAALGLPLEEDDEDLH
ncbi:MAG: tetratricopeptide repeat protein [Proteobacteria bacterium]|nr:tetratricopeptide repeat protein [Pseudomonadota bacterium]